jgi:hypothetical protein
VEFDSRFRGLHYCQNFEVTIGKAACCMQIGLLFYVDDVRTSQETHV